MYHPAAAAQQRYTRGRRYWHQGQLQALWSKFNPAAVDGVQRHKQQRAQAHARQCAGRALRARFQCCRLQTTVHCCAAAHQQPLRQEPGAEHVGALAHIVVVKLGQLRNTRQMATRRAGHERLHGVAWCAALWVGLQTLRAGAWGDCIPCRLTTCRQWHATCRPPYCGDRTCMHTPGQQPTAGWRPGHM